MSDENKINPNIEIAIQTSQKFEFYFIALVFTILGLSIQTSLAIGRLQCVCEILSWFVLLTSGLAGLWRLEWKPIAYQHDALLEEDERVLTFMKRDFTAKNVVKPSGERWTAKELDAEKILLEKRVSERKQEIQKVEKWISSTYQVHKWGFVVGIVLLVISRAIITLSKVSFWYN